MTTIEKIRALHDDLCRRFPERERVIEGCLAAVLAGEHVLLVGPPGTAKSSLVRSIAQAFGGRYYERLLTKFSLPDELFGPLSLPAFEKGRFERVIEGKLPDVEFGFVDEVFRSNSAILNSLLTLMNERLYHNDGPPIACPLMSLFGASNDLPEGGDLDALYDRFLVRYRVDYLVEQASLRAIFTAADPEPSRHLTMNELKEAQAEVAQVAVSEAALEGLIAVRKACAAEGLVSSDRRWKRSLKLSRAVAWVRGAAEVDPEDLAVLADVLWRAPREREQVERIVGDNADAVAREVKEISVAAQEVWKVYDKQRAQGVANVGVQALFKLTAQVERLWQLKARDGSRTEGLRAAAVTQLENLQARVRKASKMPELPALPGRKPPVITVTS